MLERLLEAWAVLSTSGFLSSNRFRSFFLYTKEPMEELMFGSMIRRPWFTALGASPVYMVMMPMFSLVLIGLALVDIYDLVTAKDKNLDLWLNAVVGSTCACLATTSVVLLEITLLTGTVFPIGPWFFLSSVMMFSGNAFFQTGLNLWRAFNYQPGSQERLDKLQSAINWAFIFATVSSVVGCVLFVIMFPSLCTTAGVVCAGSAVSLTAMSLLWRMTPSSIKSKIKQWVGLEIGEDNRTQDYGAESQLEYPKNEQHQKPELETVTRREGLSWCYSSKTTTHLTTDETVQVGKRCYS